VIPPKHLGETSMRRDEPTSLVIPAKAGTTECEFGLEL